jgi:hypothetical protein
LGIIDVNKYIEKIDNITEDELRENILHEQTGKHLCENNVEYLLDYLKGDKLSQSVYTEYICSSDYDKEKILFTKIVHVFCVNNIDIDEILNLIRENAAKRLERCSDWTSSKIPLIDNTSNGITVNSYFASFIYINNWGHESPAFVRKIIENDKKVLWIKNTYEEPSFFLKSNNNIFGLSYEHKHITIYSNLEDAYKNIRLNDDKTNLDNIIMEYDKKTVRIIRHKFDLSCLFEKGFFYKGPKWTIKWNKEITALKNIEYIDGLFKITIENATYPHEDFVLLDVKNIESGKFLKQKDEPG